MCSVSWMHGMFGFPKTEQESSFEMSIDQVGEVVGTTSLQPDTIAGRWCIVTIPKGDGLTTFSVAGHLSEVVKIPVRGEGSAFSMTLGMPRVMPRGGAWKQRASFLVESNASVVRHPDGTITFKGKGTTCRVLPEGHSLAA